MEAFSGGTVTWKSSARADAAMAVWSAYNGCRLGVIHTRVIDIHDDALAIRRYKGRDGICMMPRGDVPRGQTSRCADVARRRDLRRPQECRGHSGDGGDAWAWRPSPRSGRLAAGRRPARSQTAHAPARTHLWHGSHGTAHPASAAMPAARVSAATILW